MYIITNYFRIKKEDILYLEHLKNSLFISIYLAVIQQMSFHQSLYNNHIKNFHGFRGPSVEEVLSLINSFRNKKGKRKFTRDH